MDPFTAALLGSAAGGLFGMFGADKAADAQEDASRENIAFQRDVYNDQRRINRPGYVTGGAATNILANQYGIAPQNYDAAYDYQPPPGTAQTGKNGLMALLSRGQTATGGGSPADPSYDWDAYFNAYEDLGGENGWGNPAIRVQFGNNRDAFLQAHYNNSGKSEGRELNQIAAGSGSFTNGLTADPMKAFLDSPDGRIAVSGFRGVDVPEVNGAFATGGKLLSGAQKIALDDRGKARLSAGYGNYTNGLRSLAGQNQTAINQVGGAASQYGAAAGSSIINAGNARANGLAGGYDAIGRGLSGAADAYFKYGGGGDVRRLAGGGNGLVTY